MTSILAWWVRWITAFTIGLILSGLWTPGHA